MKNVIFTIIVLFGSFLSTAQNYLEKEKPKLVIGIVVDQMRYDYLTRFYDKYGNNGFKRLINNGFNCENANFNYIPTYTAVGHTSIYTGTTPSYHGIISNNWYDKFLKKSIYCVDDDNYKTVGAKNGGKKSPYRLQSTTITDALHLAQNMHGKVIGISIKDRAAILPVGHTANAAYWFEGKKEGKFISSSYYMEKLPNWVEEFNKKRYAKKYLNQDWKTLYPIDSYTESILDENEFERSYKGINNVTFPYNLKKLQKENGGYDLIKSTPFGNSILVDFAKAAIINENLGKGDYTDFLAISFSSTDYIGHQFGVDSKEVEDTYLRLDKDLANLLDFLDNKVGKDNYTLFLTADHAAVQVPEYLKSLKINAGYIDKKEIQKFIFGISKKYFNTTEVIEDISNFQIFLNKSKIAKNKLEVDMVAKVFADEIINYPGVFKTITAHTLQNTNFTTGILNDLQNGYNQKLSGDVFIIPNPQTIIYPKKGSTHGSGFSYDTHVPLIFYGKGIKKGNSKSLVPIINIAPTIANLLQIENPDSNTGEIIKEILN